MGAPMVTRVKLVLTIFYLQQQTTQTIMKFKHGDKVKIIQRKPSNTTGSQNYNQPNGDVGIICYLIRNIGIERFELKENKDGTGNYYGLYGDENYYFQDDDLELVSTDFVLPEKWFIKITDENSDVLKQYYNTLPVTNKVSFQGFMSNIDVTLDGSFLDYNSLGNKCIDKKCTKITLDQFKQYVLKKVIPEYVRCTMSFFTNHTEGRTYKVFPDGYVEDDNRNKSTLTWDGGGFVKSTKEAYDAQFEAMKTNKFKKGDYIVITECNSGTSNGKLNHCYKLIDDDYRFKHMSRIPLDTPAKKARYATPEEIDEYDRLGEPYDITTLNVQQIPVDESLVGRYLKALRNNPRGVQVTTGNYVLITGSGCVKVENSKSTWACSYIKKGEFELMPEGFVPPTEPKAAAKSSKIEDLVEEAKRRYPVGCKAKCFVTRKFYEITEDVTFLAYPDGNVYSYLKGELYHNHRSDGNWAEVELPILGQVYLQATDPTENLLITKPMNEYTAEEALAELKRRGFKEGVKYVYMCADGTYNESDICTATRQPSIRCDGDYIDCGGGYLWSSDNPSHLHRGPISEPTTNPCKEIVIPKLEEGRSRYDWFAPPAFQAGTSYQAIHNGTPNYLDPASLLPKTKLPI